MAFWLSSLARHISNISSCTICAKRYVKPLIRRPLAVLSVDESKELHKKKSNNLLAYKTRRLMPLNLLNDNNLKYEFLKDGDERFGDYVNRAHKGRNMEIKNPKIILEGVRLITDAINTNANISCIYFTRKEILAMLPLGKLAPNTNLYNVNEKEMKIWSEATQSSGLLAVVYQPKDFSKHKPSLPVALVLDGIEDEGHVGTLIRSAAATGVEKVFVTKSTADPWSPKVLKAAMGGHFHVPVIKTNSHILEGYAHNYSSVCIIDLKDSIADKSQSLRSSQIKQRNVIRYDRADFKKNSMLIIGCEESHEFIDNPLLNTTYLTTMPNFGTLGPAISGSIILYEMRRQFANK